MPIPERIPADRLLDAIHGAGVEFVVAVPDTHQRTLLEAIEADAGIQVVRAATEDEGVAICAGLIVAGRRPLLQIQHAGLYACVNNLRGIGLDGAFPIVMLVGLLGRDPARAPRENFGSMVRLAEPLLDALTIPYHLLETTVDLPQLAQAYGEAEVCGGPVAVLLGEESGPPQGVPA
jgi:sulfopyruvate decarboxylase TPP-binding subunit